MYTIAKAKIAATKPVIGILQKPTPVCYIGEGKVKQMGKIVKSESIDNVLVMTDNVLLGLGLLDDMLEGLKNNNIKYTIFSDVKPDPTFSIVNKALKVCKEKNCQGVIAFGGGSVIDSSKTVAAAITNNVDPKKLAGQLKVKKDLLPLFAVPTTAGTGSEVTMVAVISDDETHQKFTIISPKVVPKVAILDPALTIGLPPSVTSSTALDALTHAVEAYTTTFANDETDRYALKAINLICNNINTVYDDPKNIEAREALLVGSFYAGMAFTRAYIGYVHAFAHNIGGKFGIPHGLANAVLLPHIMKTYRNVSKDRFANLCDLINLEDKKASQEVKADAFIKYLYELNKKLDIPERLEKFPKDSIDNIIDLAFKECHGNYPVPIYYTKENARKILEKVCAK